MCPMKRLFSLAILAFAVSAVMGIVTACGNEDFEGEVKGAAIMTVERDGDKARVTRVSNGDAVTLCVSAIAGQACNLSIVNISGVDYNPDVHYLVDGAEVGVARQYKDFFALPYTVKGLAPGEHTLSCEAPTIYHNITYRVDVASTTFTVED